MMLVEQDGAAGQGKSRLEAGSFLVVACGSLFFVLGLSFTLHGFPANSILFEGDFNMFVKTRRETALLEPICQI